MIKDIKELNFPAYATLDSATVTLNDMGDRSISTQVKISGEIVPDFSYDWELEFKGERYIHPVRRPQGMKDNTSRNAKIDLVFHHWAIYEMKREFFVEMASTSAGTAIADKYIASLGLNLGDFVTAFNLVLNHYFGGRIVIKLNPEWQYDTEAKFVSISYSYIWDVLQQIHDIYGVRWTLKTNAEGVCEILMGYPAEEVSHIFEYGFEGGLLSVQHQVQSTEIRNRLLGRGGEKNLPYRYFKDKDPNNPLFEADPDWIPELVNIAFTELRGKTFRDYVKGWKAKHYSGTAMAEPTDAYLAGYNAEKFDPIEYVDDKESIEKYGVLVGALENNEEIYPSIQGAPGDVDMIVDAEQVTDDDVDAAVENDSVTTNLESGHQTYRNAPANSTITIQTLTKRYFSVPAGKVGNLDMSLTVTGKYSNVGDYEPTYPILKTETVNITVHDSNTDEIVKSSVAPVVNLPAGDYYYMITADVETNYDKASMVTLNIESVYLYVATPNKEEGWKSTFDIWVRNIWGSSRNVGETDQQYADRVWAPILGDRTGGEARVVFVSGWLSFSSDWEFPIVGYAYDDSKTDSHWRLTLAKSEAELEASGKYIPYEGYNASAGDRFFFIGIDMPYQYVMWAEERLDDYKRDRLLETAQINPAWVIKTDKVRLNQDRNGAFLVDSINTGAQIRLASKQFISGPYESLYVQSVTYKWQADTLMYPDVELVVSDKVATVKNPVAQMQGSIETLQRQVGSLSNIQQIIRQVCDQLYLRKDGVEDLSKSPTRFLGKITGEKFRQGQIGGRDWGIYRDENGNAIIEADKMIARQGLFVSTLEINEATYVGGLQINSAASMIVTSVENNESGYVCYFDQKQGSVVNKFRTDDIVLCQKFDPEDNEIKFYKARVIAVDETSVILSKTDINGSGIPAANDNIIHYGNYTDKNRQFVIIRDVIGGGYERMLMDLNSVNSNGTEYYFAGKQGASPRWFIGNEDYFAKFENGVFSICGDLKVGSSGLENFSEWKEKQDQIDATAEGIESINNDISGIHDQIDGVVENWSEKGLPLVTKYPVTQWATDADKIAHINDTYINIEEYVDDYTTPTSGRAWRWCKCGNVTESIVGITREITSSDWEMIGRIDPLAPYTTVELFRDGYSRGPASFAFDTEIDLYGGPNVYVKVESATGDVYIKDPSKYFVGYYPIDIRFTYTDSVQVTDKDGNTFGLHWHPIADSDAVKALKRVNDFEYLAQTLGKSVDVEGAVLAQTLAVKDGDNNVNAMLNGSDLGKDDTYGKLMMASGIPTTSSSGSINLSDRAKEATTRIYEDGHIESNDLTLRKGCKIGEDMHLGDFEGIGYIEMGEQFVSDDWLRIAEGSLNAHSKSYHGVFQAISMSGCAGHAMLISVGGRGFYCVSRDSDVGLEVDAPNAWAHCVPRGIFAGLRPKTRVFTSNMTTTSRNVLDEFDFSVLINTTSGTCYMELPSEPCDGQEYIIESKGAGLNIISTDRTVYSMSSGATADAGGATTKAAGRYVLRFKYYAAIQQWTCSTLQ